MLNHLEKLKVGFMDVDGIEVPHKYDTTGRRKSGPTKEVDDWISYLYDYLRDENNVKLIQTSGRSIYAQEGIAARTGNYNPMIGEHGVVIFKPTTGEKFYIFDVVEKLAPYKSTVDKINEIRDYMSGRTDAIRDKLKKSDKYKDVKSVVMAPGKEVSMAIDIPYIGRPEDPSSSRVDRIDFFKACWDEVPEKYKNFISTQQEDVLGIVGKKGGFLATVFIDSSAFNIKLPINKADAVEFAVRELLPEYHATVKESFLIDDRDVESMRALYGMGGSLFTVADCSDEVGEVVRTAEINGRGYLSNLENIRGTREILDKLSPSKKEQTKNQMF